MSNKNYSFHTINSKIGPLILPEHPRTRPVSRQKTANSENKQDKHTISDIISNSISIKISTQPSVALSTITSNLEKARMKTYTLEEICQLPVSKIPEILDSQPIFLQTLYSGSQLDPQIIGTIVSRLISSDLTKFITNMAQETNFFVTASTCHTITNIETILMDLLPIVRATVWLKTDHADFLYSPTLNTNLPLSRSIVGYCAITAKDLVTEDPSNHYKFVIDIDLPLLRDIKSMVLIVRHRN